MNIMVMAGTSDAAKIIKQLKSTHNNIHITATTVTDYGAEIARNAGADQVIPKVLPQNQLALTIKELKIDVLVDATHPFAAEATRNAIKAAEATGIKYIRFERPPTQIPKNDLIHLVHSFEEGALKALELTKGRILHLAGVNTLHYLTERIDAQMMVVRVLPSVYSVEKCLKLGISAENIIAMQGTFSTEFNRALMKEYHISLMVTKESGASGGTPSKIEASLELGIPVVLVQRPEIPELNKKKVFRSLDQLLGELVPDR